MRPGRVGRGSAANARDVLRQGREKEQRSLEQRAVSDVPKPALLTADQLSQFTELLRPLANNGSGPAAPGVGGPLGGEDARDDEASLASSQGEDRDPEGELDMVWDQRRTRLQKAGSLVEKGGAGKGTG